MKTIPINTTPDGLCYGIKASYFKNASLTTLTGGGGHYPCTGVLEWSPDTRDVQQELADRRKGDVGCWNRSEHHGRDARIRVRMHNGK